MDRWSRRVGAVLCFVVLLVSRPAESDPLPAALQAGLVVKVAGYDRNMRGRAGASVRVLVVARNNDDDARWSLQLRAELGRTESIAGLPHTEGGISYTNANDLAASVKNEHAAIVILSSSLSEESEAIRTAFDGLDVLTAAPDADMTRRGVVLGFELSGGKPKLFFNLRQAGRQNVALSAEVLKLMTVYQ